MAVGWASALGGAAGGAFSGGFMSLLPGGSEKFFQGLALGAVSGFAGAGAGYLANKYIANVAINGLNITSPVVKGIVGGGIGGAVGGYAGGFTGGLLQTGNLNGAHQAGLQGLRMGAGIGAVQGFATSYAAARSQGLNPWTGKPKNAIMIGGNQNRVDKFGKDFGAETISDSWPDGMKAFIGKDVPNPSAQDFNRKWINGMIDNNRPILDIGRSQGFSKFYHGIELNAINTRGYQNVYSLSQYQGISNNIRIIRWKN